MSDFPENLQIKREPSPPSTPEDKSPKNIKAKLNLHVKRRLQDQLSSENATISTAGTQVAVTDIKQEPHKNETARQKRPYHKRSDKYKSSSGKSLDSTLTSSTETTTTQRKYKHKIKQIVANESQDILTEDNGNAHHQNIVIPAGAISAGDDEDGGNDNDLKSGREKEKCPDVLGMVLSMKKRALMQDPQVQNFFKEIMDVIKN